MLPAIPVVLKTAATSIAKQAAVDAASGMLSGAAKKKLSKVTENNSDKQRLEREYSKTFKDLEEVDTSNNVMSIQDSFNSKLDSIVSTDPESSNLIKAVKDSNKATAELVSESLKEVNADVSTLAGNLEAVNANIESVGQMSTLAAETSAMGVGSSSNFISGVADAVKNVIQTLLGGTLLLISGALQSISRKLDNTKSEEGGDTTGMSGLNLVGDEKTEALKKQMDEAYTEMNKAKRLDFANKDAYATQFYKSGFTSDVDSLKEAFSDPSKALEQYIKANPDSGISISDDDSQNFLNLVKANKDLKFWNQGYVPFSKDILGSSDEDILNYYSEYKQVGEESTKEQIRARKEDYEDKKAKFEEATGRRKSEVSKKISDKVMSLLAIDNMSSEEVLEKLTTDEDGKVVNTSLANLLSYYSTDKGKKKNEYNLSQESIDLYDKVVPNLVKGLKSYIDKDSLSDSTEGEVTFNSSNSDFLKYVVGLGGDLNNTYLFGNSENSEVFKEAVKSIRDSKLKLVNSSGESSREAFGLDEKENTLSVIHKGMDKYDDIYLAPVSEDKITDKDIELMEKYNGISYEDLMNKLEGISQKVDASTALNVSATAQSAQDIKAKLNTLDNRSINVINQPVEMDQ